MKISKMSLGTAQLGFDYGVANEIGKPSVKDAHAILKSAMDYSAQEMVEICALDQL